MMSMTGFGRARFQVGSRSYRVELRSLNHRFLDVQVRQPWWDSALENRYLTEVRARLARGRVDVTVQEESAADAGAALRLNEGLAAGLAGVLQQLTQRWGIDPAAAAALVGPVKDLVSSADRGVDADEMWAAIGPHFRQALDELLAMRRREGDALARGLREHLAALRSVVDEIAGLAADEPERHRARLTQRLERLRDEGVDLDATRLAQEAAVLADRTDVTEEILRLRSHLDQLDGLIGEAGPLGRKLDFLLQELHRELNTIGSKTQTAGISHRVVDAKAAVEKMRELGQNVE